MTEPLKLPNGAIVYQPSYVHPSAVIAYRTRVGAFCDIAAEVQIGYDCNIQAHVTIPRKTRIGNRVFLGPQVCILNDKYPPNHSLQPVLIEDDVVIGGAVVILPGVTIHKGAVIGAGSIVTKNVPADSVFWGAPARKKGSRAAYVLHREEMRRVAG